MNEIINVLEEVAENINEYQKVLAANEGIGYEIAAASVGSAKGIVQDRILEERLKNIGLKA